MPNDRFPKSNLHTHTVFCDGKDTGADIVQAALGMGMESLGFSGHAHTPFDLQYAMTPEATVRYREQILEARKQLGDRIDILLGLEQDIYSVPTDFAYDYLLGSVHYVLADGEYCEVDGSREAIVQAAERHFGGDMYGYVRAYYETVAQVADKTHCDIVGHFDLVTKFNRGGVLFDENDPRALHPALEALDALLEKDVVFEINTGAIARGYRKTAYPAPSLLRRIAERGGRVTLSADAHCKEHLLFGFALAADMARAAGLSSVLVLTQNGWRERGL